MSGGSLIGTSANLSGRCPIRNPEDALKLFDGKVDMILDGGVASNAAESTVVLWAPTGLRIMREGGIGLAELRAVLPHVIVVGG